MRRTCCLLQRYEEALRCYEVGSHGTHATESLLTRRGRPDLLTTFEDLMRHTDRRLREADKVTILRAFAAENKKRRGGGGGGAEGDADVSTRYHQLFTRLVQSHPRTHGPPFALLQAALECALELRYARSAEVLLERYLQERAEALKAPARSGDRLRQSANPATRSAAAVSSAALPSPGSRLPTTAAAAALRDDTLARLLPGKAGPQLARAFRLTDLASSVGVLPTLRTALVLVSHAAAAAAATTGPAAGSYADVIGTLARIEGAAALDAAALPRAADVAAATGALNDLQRPGRPWPPPQESYFKELAPGLRASADYQTAVLSALADVVEGASARLRGLLLGRLRGGGGDCAVASPAEAAQVADARLALRQLRSRLALLRAGSGGGGGGGGGGGSEGPLALEQFKHALRGAEAMRDAEAAAEAADAAVRFVADAGAAAGDVAEARAQYDARKLRVAAEAALDCAFRGVAGAAVQPPGSPAQRADEEAATPTGGEEKPVEGGRSACLDVAAVEQLWAELSVRFPPQPQPAQQSPASPPSPSPSPAPATEATPLPAAPQVEGEAWEEEDAEAAAAAAARQVQDQRRQRRRTLRRQHAGDFRACMAHAAWRVWVANEAVLRALPPPSTSAPQEDAADGSAMTAAAAAAELGASLRCASQAYAWWVAEAAEEEEVDGVSGAGDSGMVEHLMVLSVAGDVPGFERVVSGRRDLAPSVVGLRQLCYASARRRAERQLAPPSGTGDGCGELLPLMHVGAIHPLSPYADAAAYHRWAMMCTPLVMPVLAPPPADVGEVVAPLGQAAVGRKMAPAVTRARVPAPVRMAERSPQAPPRLQLQPQRSSDVDVSPPVLPSSSAKTGRAPTGMYMNAVRVRNDGRPVSKIKSI